MSIVVVVEEWVIILFCVFAVECNDENNCCMCCFVHFVVVGVGLLMNVDVFNWTVSSPMFTFVAIAFRNILMAPNE